MNPVLIHIDLFGLGFTIYSYGFMLLIALVSGCGLIVYLAGREGMNRDWTALTLIGVVFAALIGARLMGVATNFNMFRQGFPLSFFDFDRRGVVAYGGFIAGFIVLWNLARKQRRPVGRFMDLCAPSIALGVGFARVGCFLAGCCHGQITEAPWGVHFPGGGLSYNEQIMRGVIRFGDAPLPVHPTQLYESLFGFLLFGFLLRLLARLRFKGQVIAAFFGLYAVFRFGVEFFRGDSVRGIYGGLSTSQYIAMGTMAIVAGFLAIQRRKAPSGRESSRCAADPTGTRPVKRSNERSDERSRGKKSHKKRKDS